MFVKIKENLHQPKPFYVIFMIEMWERFGFYGMQAILVYYMIQKMGYPDSKSFDVYAALVALVYGFTSIGGYIGDHYLGTKRTIILGALVLAIGYFLLGIPDHNVMFFGMGLVAVGTGLFKANPPSLLSKCYQEGDSRIDGAFTLYYMAINIGSFFSLAFVPVLADHFGWSVGFWASSAGLLITLINFLMTYSWMKHIDSPVGHAPLKMLRFIPVIVGTVILAGASSLLLQHLSIAHWLLLVIGIVVLGAFFRLIILHHGRVRRNLIVALVLMLEAILFFVLYMQMPTSLTLYAVHNVHPVLLGVHINPLSFQALNSVVIVVASPILAYFYTHMGKLGRDFTLPEKFTIGMFLCAGGFFLGWFSGEFGGTSGIVSSWWIVGIYTLQSLGELLISGLGLSMVAQLVPQRYMGFMMGVWFMTTASASVLAGFVAGLTHIPQNVTNPLQTLPIYTHVFLEIGIFTLVFSLFMLLLMPKLNKVLK
jgi:POT family proton-dependent oligopeptide transporter